MTTQGVPVQSLVLLLVVLAAVLALVAVFQPLYVVTEEDFVDRDTKVSSFHGSHLRNDKIRDGQLVETALVPYGSPAFDEVNMRPVLQAAGTLVTVSAGSLLAAAVLLLVRRWRPALGTLGFVLLVLGIVAGLAGLYYPAANLADPIRTDVDVRAGFFPGSYSDPVGALSWGPGAAWYLLLAAAILAIVSLIQLVRRRGSPIPADRRD